jgi:class 3 adenylate cyclase/predicted ATPase
LEARGGTEGERKTITALFADIKGSMELIEDLDPEEARRIVDPALQLMMDAVHRYEGYVAQSTGDGIFALFGAPIAHEDHPQRALFAALRMQEEARRHGDQLHLDRGIRLQIRVGINTGEVVVRSIRKDDLHTDYLPIGHSTSLAARMEGLARPGSIVVSEHTHKLTEGYFQFTSLGPARVKGASEAIEVYEVMGVGPLRTKLQVAAQRGLVRFVGRQVEMDQMKRALALAKEGHGQIVAAVGEAGVGKSRLVHEFKLVSEDRVLVLETFSVSHGKAFSYLPLVDLLKNYSQIRLQDDESRRREKVTDKVLNLDRSLEDTLPYIFFLLGISEPTSTLSQMDSEIKRRRTFDAVKRLLLRESLNQPLLIIFEDLHWLDAETEAFLDVFADSLATTRVLLVVNYRSQYRHNWGGKTYYTQLRLDPLAAEHANEMLTALLGDGAELEDLKQLTLSKTEGNPFFMEELVQTLAEEGVLAGERGDYRMERPPSELHIPATVQGVLASRIDRLPSKEKDLLQTLAVVGKKFPLGLLRRIVNQGEEDLYLKLSHLQAGEFIYEQPAFPEPKYTFKHSLTQEVAYDSLLREQRGVLHERAARSIEELYSETLDEHFSELAHHYGRTANTPKAVEYSYLAGEQAAQRSAYTEAIDQLSRGAELIAKLPETRENSQQELLLRTSLGRALVVTRGFTDSEAEQAFVRARELSERVGEAPQLFRPLQGLFQIHLLRSEHETVPELAKQLLRLAQGTRDPAHLLLAHHCMGVASYWRGELCPAREHLQEVIRCYDPKQYCAHDYLWVSQDPGVSALGYLGRALWSLGYPDQALAKSREGLVLAHELSHPFSEATALLGVSRAHALRGELQASLEAAEAMIAVGGEHGFPYWVGIGSFIKAKALVDQGRMEAGIEGMRAILEVMRSAGAVMGSAGMLTILAGAHGKAGQVEEGLALMEETFEFMTKTGEREVEAEIHRVRAELLLVRSPLDPTDAEAGFRKAIDIARSRSAKSLELRAATSLARLWQKQGKKAEARKLLADIYDWFTEGFDTGDLKEAKALLEELAG